MRKYSSFFFLFRTRLQVPFSKGALCPNLERAYTNAGVLVANSIAPNRKNRAAVFPPVA
jgi:hypothetical protein